MSYLYDNSPSRTRTYDSAVNSRVLYRLSYRGISYQDLLADSLNYYIKLFLFVKYFFALFDILFCCHHVFPSTICIIACSKTNVKYFFQIFFKIVFELFLLCLIYSSSSSTATDTLDTAVEIATITTTTMTSPIRSTSNINPDDFCSPFAF